MAVNRTGDDIKATYENNENTARKLEWIEQNLLKRLHQAVYFSLLAAECRYFNN